MSNSTGLSTVSELVKQTSLLNNQQYTSAKQGLEFAETAIKTTQLTHTSQQNKLENSLRNSTLSKENYDQQTNQLKQQFEIDRAPWEVYVKKLRQLIEQYSSHSESQRSNKRIFDQSSSKKITYSSFSASKRTRITFSSSSSDSDTPSPISPITPKTVNPSSIRYDSSTTTDPLEFSLRSPFPSTPNIIPFTAQTNHITQRIPLQHVNEVAAKQIVLLHDEGQLVRWNDVIWRILTYFHVQDLGNLGIQRADQIPCVDNLIRTQNKINIYIDAYTYWQTIGTLNELENDLARIFHKKDYPELLIGPIEKQPKIEELFRLKSLRNDLIKKDLKSSDVLKYLDQYMTKEYAWRNENEINPEHFLKFVAEQVQVKHTSQLGIRIKSVYLARNCIKAMQANQRKTMEIARNELNEVLMNLAQQEVKKISNTINDKLGNGNEQRRIYAAMKPLDIINDLVEICREICQDYSSFRKILPVLHTISSDETLRNIFQIAICHGHLALPDQTTQSKKSSNKTKSITNKKIYFDSSDSEVEITSKIESPKPVINHPDENEILQSFKEQIGSLKIITFSSLSRIEQRLCETFHVTHFHQLGYGTLMNYIQQNEQLLFPIDIKFHFSSSSSSSECNEKPLTAVIPVEDLEEFILQAFDRLIDEKYLEQIICYHYQIESFEQLGHGSYRSILKTIEKNKKSKNRSVHYECLMFDEISLLKQRAKSCLENTHLEKQALHAIDQCPLLGNLLYDTQWNLHFRLQLGKLKPFLLRHAIPTLEIDSTNFLKVSSNSTIDLFKQSLYNFDSIFTSGHLVSILIQHHSLHHAPLSLLSNIMHTFLLSISLDNRLYDFLIRIFLRIPFLLLSSIIQRIFLEPLIKLEGSQSKVREVFWKTIDRQDSNTITRFIQLGQHLGFTDWSLANIKTHSVIQIQQEKQLLPTTPIVIPSSVIVKVEQRSSGHNPYNFIEQIRREKFGIGLNLSHESQQLTDQLKSLIGRSLERLSKELYNSDMHFVLELIQNADDNQYNTKPSLIFVIHSNVINIYNNETGFQEDHIQALCDIGKSTKGKHKQGYIGQKGIGFKSVFTICDRPEIYSNGYQICFDLHHGSIGYILPSWITNETRENEYFNWTTRICLPLKSENEMAKHRSRSLTESFNDLHPSLLLFLNRLRSITIDNRSTNSKQVFERFDIPGTSIVELHCGEIIEKWFIMKKQFVIPDNFDNLIEATEIALAFPLHEMKVELIKQDVYAYLPLRTFGFTFIIQADFEVPSSRQDILGDSLWNQFLLNEIPTLFLSSLDAFEQERSSLPLDPLRLFLRFLPNETSIYSNHLFTPVCRKILHLLRSCRFLPVINDDHLHMPNECVLVNDLTIKEILTPELLYNHLQLYYLDDEFSEYEKQLYELGVHRLDHHQLIDIIKRIFTSEITFENRNILSKWLICLHRCLNQLSLIDEEQVLKHVKFLKIFPLKNYQEFISLNNLDQIVFFPSKNLSLPKSIENDLMMIEEDLWENSLQIQRLLERLGVEHLTHKSICEQHIFPIFEDEQKWKEKSSEVLIAYVTYIYDLWSKQKHFLDLSRLKSIVQLLTNEHFKQPMHHAIYFSSKYGNPYDLSRDFHGYNWIFLSDEYSRGINDRKKLHQFFSELGVSNFLFPITNSTYEQLYSLIELQSRSMNKKLFVALEETWSNESEEILRYLKESLWIPTIQMNYSANKQTDQIESTIIHGLNQPNKIYQKSQQIQRIFAHHVPYIDVEINPNSSFIHDLGLINQIQLNDILSMLFHWCENSIFCTSLAHIQNIYEYISQNMSSNELRELIEHKPIFFLPLLSSSISEKTEILAGRFVDFSVICWSDPTNLFTKYSSMNRFILEPYYTEQKSIFLNTFAIPLNPPMKEYIQLLVHIASLPITKETIRDAFRIFKTLGNLCKQSNQFHLDQLSDKSIFPTKDNRWVSLRDNPLLSDNDNLAQLFTQVTTIPLIDLPSPDVMPFFNLCEIKTLSSSITIEHIVENPSDGSSIENLLSPLIPYIQLFMKSRPEFSEAYHWTKTIDLSSRLLHLQFYIIDDLQLIYRLKSDPRISIIQKEKSSYDENQRSFYIPREWMEQSKFYRNIFHSFAQLFIPNHNNELICLLGNFLSLLYHEEEDNLESFAKYQQFDLELDHSEESPWRISSTSKVIQRFEPKIDEEKVRTLLENVTQEQKKRQEFKRQHSLDTPRLEHIHSGRFSSNIEISYENVAQHTKNFNIEDLTHQVLDNRESTIGSNQESLEKIGRWGEQWVNEYLRAKYHRQLQSNEIEIIWLNEILERGKPYDFILKNLLTNQIQYIEVKSTLSNHRQLIPITFNELQYCCSLSDMNEHFQIYRVYNTGQLTKVKLHIVENVEEKLRKHFLELFLLI